MAQYVTMTDRKIATLIILNGIQDTSKDTDTQTDDCITATTLAKYHWISPSYAHRILTELHVQGLIDLEQSEMSNGVIRNLYCINRQGNDYLESLILHYLKATDAIIEYKRERIDLFTRKMR